MGGIFIRKLSKKVSGFRWPLHNAAMESWNHSFKVEAIHGERFKTRSEAKYQVFEYIEVYYLCPLGTIANGFI
jgi:Integrase core domain